MTLGEITFVSEPVSWSGPRARDILFLTMLKTERDQMGWVGRGGQLSLLLLPVAPADPHFLVTSWPFASSPPRFQLRGPVPLPETSFCWPTCGRHLLPVSDFPRPHLSLATVWLRHRKF